MELLIDGPVSAATTIVLAHGAGAGMDTPFMNVISQGLAERGLRSVRFEFPYMRARRADGKRRPPDPPRVLRAAWNEVIASLECERLVIGGKSMGGRVASMVADEADVSGLVCLGYPFHAPGKPDKLRVAHLETLRTAGLILQGTRDPFGSREEVEHYPLSGRIEVRWLDDGDHSFKPRAKSGRTHAQNLGAAIEAIADFVGAVVCERRP